MGKADRLRQATIIVGGLLWLMPVGVSGYQQNPDEFNPSDPASSIHGSVHVPSQLALGPEPGSIPPRLVIASDSTSAEPVKEVHAAGEGAQNRPWFFKRLLYAYVEEFKGTPETAEAGPETPRRALPSPWDAPPFPMSEYQGNPLIGVPVATKEWPLMRAMNDTTLGDFLKSNRIRYYG